MADSTLDLLFRLLGVDDASNKLKNLGATGKASLDELSQSGTRVAGSLTSAGAAIDTFAGLLERSVSGLVSGGLSRLEAGLTGIVNKSAQLVGLSGLLSGGLVVGFERLVSSSASAVDAIGALAQVSGSTTEQVSGLIAAVSSTGVSSDELEKSFRRTAVSIERDWPNIVRSVKDGALSIEQAHLGVEQSFQRLATASRNLANVERDSAQTSIRNALSVRSAQLSLLDAETRLHELVTGERLDPESQRQLDISRARLQVDQARAQLQEAQERQAREAAEAQEKRDAAALASRQASLQIEQALRAEEEARANNLQSIAAAVSAIAAGSQSSFQGLNLSAENVTKAIILSAGESARQISSLRGSLNDLRSTAPSVQQVIFRVADLFKNLGNESLKTAIASRLFGEEAGPRMARALSLGSGFIREQSQRLEALGLTATTTSATIARKFEESQASLTSTARAVRDRLTELFSPAFTRVFTALRENLESNAPAILEFGRTVALQFNAVSQAVANILRGTSIRDFIQQQLASGIEGDNPFLNATVSWQVTLEGFATKVRDLWTRIKSYFTEIDPQTGLTGFQSTLATIESILEKITGLFNRLTGSRLSPEEMGIALLVGQLTGVNQAVTNIVTGLGQLALAAVLIVGGLVVTFGAIPTAVAAGIAAVLALVVVFWDEIKSAASSVVKFITNLWSALPTFIQDTFRGAASVMVDVLTAPFRSAATAIVKIANFLAGVWRKISPSSTTAEAAPSSTSTPSRFIEDWSPGGTGDRAARNATDVVNTARRAIEAPPTSTNTPQTNFIKEWTPGAEGDLAARNAVAALARVRESFVQNLPSLVNNSNAGVDIDKEFNRLRIGLVSIGDASQSTAVRIGQNFRQVALSTQEAASLASQAAVSVNGFVDSRLGPRVYDVAKSVQVMNSSLRETGRFVAPSGLLIVASPGFREQLQAAAGAVRQVQESTRGFSVGSGVQEAGRAFEEMHDRILSSLRDVDSGVSRTVGVISTLPEEVENAFSPGRATVSGSEWWKSIQDAGVTAFDSILLRASETWSNIQTTFTSGASTVGSRLVSIWQDAATGASNLSTTVSGAISSIVSFISELPSKIQSEMTTLGSILSAPFTAVLNVAVSVVNGIVAAFSSLPGRIASAIAGIGAAASAAASAGANAASSADTGGGGGFAGGGHVRGPGTSTSDSILAWLSRGEFVVQAAAVAALVRQFGSGIMEMINSGVLPFPAPRLSTGGFALAVSRAAATPHLSAPRLAGGGFVPSSNRDGPPRSVIQLRLDNGASVNVSGRRDEVDRFLRAAATDGRRRSGRSPSWES